MLSVAGLCTDYADARGTPVRAVRNVAFDVPQGSLFTLLGPSGCGKTTTLRSIAGLERPRAGEVAADGVVVYSSARRVFVPPNRRGFGMVFQSYAIWPHMDVFGNASFPLRAGRTPVPRAAVRDKVMRVLAAVGLDALADRPATRLSGGQQQRLALARALVMEPRLLLLDEPLSNLDAKLRERMRFELKRLQRELGITTVYVTHDQGEALALSDMIGVMNDGQVVQVGTPRAIYERPATRFVADFVGTTNFVVGRVVAHDDVRPGHVRVDTEIGPLCAYAGDVLAPGDAVLLSIRPEDVELVAADRRGDNVRHGVVDQHVFLGEATDVHVKVGERVLLARAHPRVAAQVGAAIGLALDPAKCVALKAAREPSAVA